MLACLYLCRRNTGDVFVTPVRALQNIADVFVSSVCWLVCICVVLKDLAKHW